MNIAQLTPGAGENFYCENCMRDAALMRALRQAGHEPLSVPLYLPPLDEQTGQSRRDGTIFFGGINVYLQQKSFLFRHSPRWLDRLFDAKWLLRWAGRKSDMTDARILGETTLSMLRGREGRQRKELTRLSAYLASEKPDVLIFSNALLLGMAEELHNRTGAARVCWLQDEDHFLDTLEEPYRSDAWEQLRRCCRDVERFLAPSRYYAGEMIRRLGLPEGKVEVVPQGVEADLYEPAGPKDKPVVGFLSQFCESKGLDLLVEAIAKLRTMEGMEDVRLLADGGQTRADAPYVQRVRTRIDELGLADRIELLETFDRPTKQEFLRRISILAVPTRQPEAFGLYILEALAAGVPVVVPHHGGQAELLQDTGGGLVFEPGDVDRLAGVLHTLLGNHVLAERLGSAGRRTVQEQFDISHTAGRIATICKPFTKEEHAPHPSPR